MMHNQTQTPFTGQGDHGFYQNPDRQPKFSWQLGASQNLGPSFHLNPSQPKIPFLEALHLPDLSRLLNDLIYHDPCWLRMPTKFLSDISKLEGKPGEDPGDHVTKFNLWCSTNTLKDDSF